MRKAIALLLMLTILGGCAGTHNTGTPADTHSVDLQKTSYTTDNLMEWGQYGQGTIQSFRGQAVQMTEGVESGGMNLVSPEAQGKRVIVRYKVMALTPATVNAAFLSASRGGENTAIDLPEGFDGSFGPYKKRDAYFFAFHNAPHQARPFIKPLYHDNEKFDSLDEAEDGVTDTGSWHDVELGRWDGRIWLKIDGRVVAEGTHAQPHGGGHTIFRIRGTGTEHASCLIRDVRILTPES